MLMMMMMMMVMVMMMMTMMMLTRDGPSRELFLWSDAEYWGFAPCHHCLHKVVIHDGDFGGDYDDDDDADDLKSKTRFKPTRLAFKYL